MLLEGGPLGEHKGINAPGVALPAGAITAKDIEDRITFSVRLFLDGVRSRKD